jgi:thioredoxin-related protein
MKWPLFSALALAASGIIYASGSHSHDHKSTEKEASAHSQWMTNFEKAKALSKKTKKPILIDFTGSDWCGWCIRLDEEVFSKDAFKDYAKKNLVLLEIDFPRRKAIDADTKAQNEALAQKYGIRGFPTILLTDHKGEVIETTGYQQGGAKAYVKHIKGLLAKK